MVLLLFTEFIQGYVQLQIQRGIIQQSDKLQYQSYLLKPV